MRRQKSDRSQKDFNVSDKDTGDYNGDYDGDYCGNYMLSVLIIFRNWPLGNLLFLSTNFTCWKRRPLWQDFFGHLSKWVVPVNHLIRSTLWINKLHQTLRDLLIICITQWTGCNVVYITFVKQLSRHIITRRQNCFGYRFGLYLTIRDISLLWFMSHPDFLLHMTKSIFQINYRRTHYN